MGGDLIEKIGVAATSVKANPDAATASVVGTVGTEAAIRGAAFLFKGLNREGVTDALKKLPATAEGDVSKLHLEGANTHEIDSAVRNHYPDKLDGDKLGLEIQTRHRVDDNTKTAIAKFVPENVAVEAITKTKEEGFVVLSRHGKEPDDNVAISKNAIATDAQGVVQTAETTRPEEIKHPPDQQKIVDAQKQTRGVNVWNDLSELPSEQTRSDVSSRQKNQTQMMQAASPPRSCKASGRGVINYDTLTGIVLISISVYCYFRLYKILFKGENNKQNEQTKE